MRVASHTAASAASGVAARQARAVAVWPAASSCRTSTAYVEKVVKPPSTPVPRKGRTSGWAVRASVTSTMSTPIAAHPRTLTQKTVQGKPPARAGHHRVAAYRPAAPAPPPRDTAASTAASVRRRRVSAAVISPVFPCPLPLPAGARPGLAADHGR